MHMEGKERKRGGRVFVCSVVCVCLFLCGVCVFIKYYLTWVLVATKTNEKNNKIIIKINTRNLSIVAM